MIMDHILVKASSFNFDINAGSVHTIEPILHSISEILQEISELTL